MYIYIYVYVILILLTFHCIKFLIPSTLFVACLCLWPGLPAAVREAMAGIDMDTLMRSLRTNAQGQVILPAGAFEF